MDKSFLWESPGKRLPSSALLQGWDGGILYVPWLAPAGNNESKVCCPPLPPPSAQSEGVLPGVERREPSPCRGALLGISWRKPNKGRKGLWRTEG